MTNIIDIEPIPEIVVVDRQLVEDCAIAVSNGYAITEWCRDKRINYGSFMSELRKSMVYLRRMGEAEEARQEWLKEELLKLMRDIMQANPQTAFTDKGNYLGMADLPEETAKLIKKAKIRLQPKGRDEEPDEILDLEFYDKQKSIDQLGKYINMFVDRVDVNYKITLEETVTRSYEHDVLGKTQGNIIDTTAIDSEHSLLNSVLQKKSD